MGSRYCNLSIEGNLDFNISFSRVTSIISLLASINLNKTISFCALSVKTVTE